MLNVTMLSVIRLNVLFVNVIMLSVVLLNVVMLSVVVLSVVLLNVVMLNVIMLSVIMLNVVVLDVVLPTEYRTNYSRSKFYHLGPRKLMRPQSKSRQSGRIGNQNGGSFDNSDSNRTDSTYETTFESSQSFMASVGEV